MSLASAVPRGALAVLGATAFAASLLAQSRPATVTGEVVHLACSTSKGESGRGEAHGECAMTCARQGEQMAILTADAVYLVEGDYAANANARLLDFVAKRVHAKGSVAEKDGVRTINVASMALVKPDPQAR